MISRMGTQQPHFGNTVNPNTLTAKGTSSLHGRAAEATQQQQWVWTFRTEQPSHSNWGPQQQHGRHGAPGLQHTSAFRQHSPTWRARRGAGRTGWKG